MKRPQHLLKRHPASLSGVDDCSQQFFQQNDFRRTEAMSAVMHRLPEQLTFFPAPQDQNVIGREGLRYRIQNLFSRLCCFQYRDVVVNSIFCPLRQGAHVVQMGVASVPRHSIRAVRLTADRKNIARNGISARAFHMSVTNRHFIFTVLSSGRALFCSYFTNHLSDKTLF